MQVGGGVLVGMNAVWTVAYADDLAMLVKPEIWSGCGENEDDI